MERVKKGEKYWYLSLFSGTIFIEDEIEHGDEKDGVESLIDKERFRLGNYFITKEEAEVMAEKIRKVLEGAWVLTPPEGEIFSRKVEAVLNGADVIEIPSEEEIRRHYAKMMTNNPDYHLRTSADVHINVVNWLKSKIVK